MSNQIAERTIKIRYNQPTSEQAQVVCEFVWMKDVVSCFSQGSVRTKMRRFTTRFTSNWCFDDSLAIIICSPDTPSWQEIQIKPPDVLRRECGWLGPRLGNLADIIIFTALNNVVNRYWLILQNQWWLSEYTESSFSSTQTWEVLHPHLYYQEFITGRVCKSHMVSTPAIWIGWHVGNQQWIC